MALASATLIPELQHYFNIFVLNSSINQYSVDFPASISTSYLGVDRSFIRLLFDDDWPTDSTSSTAYASYQYLYTEKTDRSTWPSIIRNRILIYPGAAKYYISDTVGDNLFTLQANDITMLNRLLQYRRFPTTTTLVDSTADILYTSLTTNLSKLIFRFLDLKINNRIEAFNNIILLSSSSSVLESCYEVYVVEHMFRIVSTRST